MNAPGRWTWDYYAFRDMVSYLVFGTTTVRPMQPVKDHFHYASDKLSREIRTRVQRFAARKDFQEAAEESARKNMRLELVAHLQEVTDKIIKKFPAVRRQDVVEAFDRARDKETVRRVMED